MQLNNNSMKFILIVLSFFCFLSCNSRKTKIKSISTNSEEVSRQIQEVSESFFMKKLRYPKNKKELINYILSGDVESKKYAKKLIKYKPQIEFKNDSTNGYFIIKSKDFKRTFPKYDICKSIKSELPEIFLLNRVLFYKDGEIVSDALEYKKYRSEWWKIVKKANYLQNNKFSNSTDDEDYEFLKFYLDENIIVSFCNNNLSSHKRNHIKYLKQELYNHAKKYQIDSIFMTIKL